MTLIPPHMTDDYRRWAPGLLACLLALVVTFGVVVNCDAGGVTPKSPAVQVKLAEELTVAEDWAAPMVETRSTVQCNGSPISAFAGSEATNADDAVAAKMLLIASEETGSTSVPIPANSNRPELAMASWAAKRLRML